MAKKCLRILGKGYSKVMTLKQPVNPNWFNQFHMANVRESYSWLLEFGIQAKKIVSG
jgi:hypothetical protein